MEKSAIFCAQMVDVCRPGHIYNGVGGNYRLCAIHGLPCPK